MINLIYIMGHGFSGSTLLTFLLGSHPDIATIGEMGIAPKSKVRAEDFLCSCREAIADCGFWREVSRRMAERGFDFDIRDARLAFRAERGGLADRVLRPVQRGALLEAARRAGIALVPGAREELGRILARNRALVEVVTAIRGCRTFVDSSKRPERAVYLRRVPSFEMKVVHLVRDGRAVAWSAMKNWGIGAEAAAESWLRDVTASERARRAFPADRWLTLHHEDVCARPAEVLQAVHRFIGVAPRNGGNGFRGGDHHIIGNRMRLLSTSEIRLDERWKTALAPGQMRSIERKLGPTNRRYGYGAI